MWQLEDYTFDATRSYEIVKVNRKKFGFHQWTNFYMIGTFAVEELKPALKK